MQVITLCFLALIAYVQLIAVSGQLTAASDGNRRENQSTEMRLLNSARQMETMLQNLNEKFDRITTLERKIDEVLKHVDNSSSAMSDMIRRKLTNLTQHACSPANAIVSGTLLTGRTTTAAPPMTRDCSELLELGYTDSDVYTVYVGDGQRPLDVYCDMKTASGGWTVIQRRQDGTLEFTRNWIEYQLGFGDVGGEFWIGNDNLNILTSGKRRYKLRVELKQFNGSTAWAEFDNFKVESALQRYRLASLGTCTGTAGNSLSYHVGQRFTTMDQDHDSWPPGNCAVSHGGNGGWWYYGCTQSNLNGQYYSKQTTNQNMLMKWSSWSSMLMNTEMKIKPLN